MLNHKCDLANRPLTTTNAAARVTFGDDLGGLRTTERQEHFGPGNAILLVQTITSGHDGSGLRSSLADSLGTVGYAYDQHY